MILHSVLPTELIAHVISYLSLKEVVDIQHLNIQPSEPIWMSAVVDRYQKYVGLKPDKMLWKQYYYQLIWSFESVPIIEAFGRQCWYQHGKLHRDGDQPAFIYRDGSRWWFQHGKTHRDGDQPTIIYADGTQTWYQYDQLTRDRDQSSVIRSNGTKI
jgi:hypothetical protein